MKNTYDCILREIVEERLKKRQGRRHVRCAKRRTNPFPAPPRDRSRALPKFMGIMVIK
jgi:hypothetical protein